MKRIIAILALAAAPAILAAGPEQSPDKSDAQAQAADTPRPQSDRATSHGRHMRKHRAANHHHHRRTTSKSFAH